MTEEPVPSGTTEERLAQLPGPHFEKLVNDVLRAWFPGLASPGSNSKDAPVGFPVDALGYLPGDPPTWILAAATVTTEDDRIAEKWFGHGSKKNDVRKAAEYFEKLKKITPDAKCRLYVALSHRANHRQDLWPKVIAEGNAHGIEVQPLDASAIVSYLDTYPRGHYLREQYLRIPGELLSPSLLQDLSRESINRLRVTAALGDVTFEVERDVTATVLGRIHGTEGGVVRLVGGPGIGKTVLLAQIGDAVLAQGGIALWIPADSIHPNVSLEVLLLEVLRAMRPDLHHSAGREAIELADSVGGLVLLIDDINRQEDPDRCLAVIERLSNPSGAASSSSPPAKKKLHCVVPIWPNALIQGGLGNHILDTHENVVPVDTYSREEEYRLSRLVGESGNSISRDTLTRLGGDPFLCGLALSTDRLDPCLDMQELLLVVMSDFLRSSVSMAASGASVPATLSQVMEALDDLVGLILQLRTPEPDWARVWNDLGERKASLLFSIVNSRMLASLRTSNGKEYWHWKHRRLRDIVIAHGIAQRIANASSDGRYINQVLDWKAIPGLSDALALSIIFLPQSFPSTERLKLLDSFDAPTLAEVLRLGVVGQDEDEKNLVISRLHSLLESARPSGIRDYIGSAYWHAVDRLSTTRDTAVLETVNGVHGWGALAARMRNGDVTAALRWISAVSRSHGVVLMGMPAFQAAMEDLVSTSGEVEQAIQQELRQAQGVENIRNAMLLVAASGLSGLAEDVWQKWQSVSVDERVELLPTVVWTLSRCVDDTSSELLKDALRQWALSLGNSRLVPYDVHDIWMTLNDWAFSNAAITSWVDVCLEGSTPHLWYVVRRLDQPHAVESYVRWSAFNPGNGYMTFIESLDKLSPPTDSFEHFPVSRESRDRLWELVQCELDHDLRRLAFRMWSRHVTIRDIGRLKMLQEEDPLFTKALETRLRLRDASAAPALLVRLNQDPGQWIGFAPAVYRESGIHQAMVENLEIALSSWPWAVENIFLHLPEDGVLRIVQQCSDILLRYPRTWSALWKSGVPEGLKLVRQALFTAHAVSDNDHIDVSSDTYEEQSELKHFFSHFTSSLAYEVNRSMLETIEPFLGLFPATEVGYLAEAATGAGFTAWARKHLKDKVPDYVRRQLWLPELVAREILDRAASNANHAPSEILKTPEFFRLRERSNLDFDLLWLLEEWVKEHPGPPRFSVCALLVDEVGRGNDIEWWERLRPTDEPLLGMWEDVRYTLRVRAWEGQ